MYGEYNAIVVRFETDLLSLHQMSKNTLAFLNSHDEDLYYNFVF